MHLCTPAAVARELSPLLQNSPRREWQVSGYKTMRRRLGNSVASDYVAELIADSLGVPELPKPEPSAAEGDKENSDGEPVKKKKPSRRRKKKPQPNPQDSTQETDA